MAEPQVLDPIVGIVVNEALDAGVNPALALSLIHQESRFDPNAVSPTYVTGLAQVTNKTGSQYGQTPETRNDPVISARAGMRYFRDLLDQNKGNVGAALQAYNGGSDPQYVQNVLRHYGQYAHLEGLRRAPEGQRVAQAQPPGDLDKLKAEFLGQSAQPLPASGGSDIERLKQEFLGQSAQPVQPVSPEGQAPQPVGPQVQEGMQRIPDEVMRAAVGLPSTQTSTGQNLLQAGRELGTAAVQVGLSGLGGMYGGLPGAAAGGLAANIVTRASGLAPEEKPIAEPFGLPVRLSDLLALGGPMVAGIPGAYRGVRDFALRRTSAAGAVRAAEQEMIPKQEQYQADIAKQTEYDAAVQAQAAAEERLAAVPGQLKPQMPPRDMIDLRLDAERITQGGEYAAGVRRRYGVKTDMEALVQIKKEVDALVASGQPMPPEPQPPRTGISATHETGSVIDPNAIELQKAVRQLGGIRVSAEELQGEFGALVSNKETGTSGLLNNRTGLTPQQMAEALQQREYPITADKESLLEALRASVGGKPVYPPSAYGEAPIGTTQVTGPQVSAGTGARVSTRLYQRFNDMFGGAEVDTSPVQEAMAGIQTKLEHTAGPFQKLVADIQAEGASSTGAQVHELMKLVRPYMYSANQPTRESARQLFGAFHDALEGSIPQGRVALQQAKTAYRQELASNEVQSMLDQRSKGSMLRTDPRTGQTIVNLDTVVNRLTSKKVMDLLEPEQQAMLQNIQKSFIGTPAMPKGERPTPIFPEAVSPRLEPPDVMQGHGHLRKLSDVAAIIGTAFAGHPFIGIGYTALDLAGPQLEYALSKALLSPRHAPKLIRALSESGGVVDSQVQSLLKGLVMGGITATGGAGRQEKDSSGAPVNR